MGLLDFGKSMLGAFVGGKIDRSNQKKVDERQYQYQKQFAKNAIQWRVEDAKKAGIHPLAAMGASTNGYSPTSASLPQTGSAVGDAIANYGNKAAERKKANEMHNLNKRNIEADITLKLAQASSVAKTAQQVNAQQDVAKVPKEFQNAISSWQVGTRTPASELEDYYGGFAADIHGVINAIEDTKDNIIRTHKKQREKYNKKKLEENRKRWKNMPRTEPKKFKWGNIK